LSRTAVDWRQLALALATLEAGSLPAEDRAVLERLKQTAWDVASYAAFQHAWMKRQALRLSAGFGLSG
jgi:hypothetical protein